MKRFFVLLFAFGFQLVFAQANRFVYEVTMKPDSTNRADIKTETAYLDISPEKSLFYGEKNLQRDSLFARMRQTGGAGFDRSQMQNLRSDIDFTVTKDYKTGTKSFVSRIARDQYTYDEDREMDWKILPETVTIGNYKTQKAETHFGGRTWFAWFTTDIPLQDGPYKFSGLPGLIVKLEDARGDYAFDLKETRNIAAIPEFSRRGNIIKVKRKDFEKQMAAYRKDPGSVMQTSRNSARGGNSARSADPNLRKQMEERLKDEIRQTNNPIELK